MSLYIYSHLQTFTYIYFVGSLTRGNFRKYSAYGVFVFLILLVLDLIVESGTNAFIV